MTVDTSMPRTRRAVIAGGLGGLVALVTSALGRPDLARAGTDGDVVLGATNVASEATIIANNAYEGDNPLVIDWPVAICGKAGQPNSSGTGVLGFSWSGSGVHGRAIEGSGVSGYSEVGPGVSGSSTTNGVYGHSASGRGINGYSRSGTGIFGNSQTGVGVLAESLGASAPAIEGLARGSNTGVLGYSGSGSVPAAPYKTGVYGYAAQNAGAVGVQGASTSGTGVLATATTGTALRVDGKASFSRSGRARIPAGASRINVDLTSKGGLAGAPLLLATLQSYRSGVYVAAVRPNYPSAGKFRIYLNKAVGSATYVAWIVIG